jgi:hypothetical protein
LSGILRERIDFSQEIRKYGNIVAVSPNGQNFLLIRTKKNSNDEEEVSLSIFNMSELNFQKIKHVHLFEFIDQEIERLCHSKS